MWYMLMALLALLALGCLIYLLRCFHRFPLLEKLGEAHPLLSWLLALLPLLALGLFALINVTTLIVVLLHVAASFLLCSLLFRLLRKLTEKPLPYLWQGLAALVLVTVYLALGWANAHRVTETHYRFETEKSITRPLRLVLIADSHLGITLDGEAFAAQMARVQESEPDLVVIVGDFVDDESLKTDMQRACQALGQLNTTYGVFFVYGNHDEGYYRYRDFTAAELRESLRENGVTVLADERVPLGESFTLLGRRDRSMRDRLDMSALTADLDRSRYSILLDHQPNDYANEAAAGVDLVLSGHTHGGHLLPAHLVDRLFHFNDRRYGTELRGSTRFVVTSGISGWAIPFKTGCFSEYAVIDIVPAA